MRRLRILLLVFLPACSDAAGGSGWSSTMDTLPGGIPHVLNTPPAEGPQPHAMLVEEARIGSLDGAGADMFGQIRGISVLRDDRLVVLDNLAKEIRIFSPDGAHMASWGRGGEGPGELREPYGLMIGPDDRIWVPDHANKRMNVFHPDSGFVQSFRFDVFRWGYTFSGAMGQDGRIFEESMTIHDRNNVQRVFETRLHVAGTDGPGAAAAEAVQRDGFVQVDSLLMPTTAPPANPDDTPSAWAWESPDGRMRGYMGVPFYGRGVQILAGDGAVWTALPDYRISRWMPGGDTTLVLETVRTPLPVTPAERDSAIAVVRKQLQARGVGEQDWSKIPATKPLLTSMFLSADDELWVETVSPDSLRVFDVYHADGRLKQVVATTLRPLSFIKPFVRGDRMWMVVTDEYDVQYVVRARLEPVGTE